MNKKGMTLLELMVYMAIAALLLAPVVFLMNNSSKNMARSATNTELRMSGRDVMNLMYEDIRNLGFKLDPGTLSFYKNAMYADSSSFKSGDGVGSFDTLTFIKGKLNAAGLFAGADTVRYVVTGAGSNTILERQVWGIDVSGNPAMKSADLTRRLVQNVRVLQFEYMDSVDVFDTFNETIVDNYKKDIRFIKVYLVLKDDKEIAAARPRATDIANYNFAPTDLAIYERHEIMIPVPNNGLFPCGGECNIATACSLPQEVCDDPCNPVPSGDTPLGAPAGASACP